MNDKPEILLTPADRISPAWVKLEKFLTDRLNTLRAQNDAKDTPEGTAWTRGRIAEVKFLLGKAKDDGRLPE